MNSKIKIIIGFTYLLCLSLLLYYIFSKYDLKDLIDINFLKDNQKTFVKFKEQNIFIVSLIFFFFSIIWVLLLGFGSPIALAGGFIFGKWLGAFLVLFSLTIGATLLYTLGVLFFKELINSKLAPRLGKLISLFNKNEILYFTLYRFTGGGLPFFMQNLLPVIFNMKIKNYFIATLIGLIPGVFILVSIGSGIDKFLIKDSLDWSGLIKDPEIYFPIFGFVLILIAGIFIKRKFFIKN
ncbi:MAG: hypothetical protein RL496_188 [Pseudomonadota bacterium]